MLKLPERTGYRVRVERKVRRMAGSYNHILHGYSMIENMHDAGECIEELHWLVERAIGKKEAKRLLDKEYYPMYRGEKPEDEHLKRIKKLRSK